VIAPPGSPLRRVWSVARPVQVGTARVVRTVGCSR
jgi:hypothetical protein